MLLGSVLETATYTTKYSWIRENCLFLSFDNCFILKMSHSHYSISSKLKYQVILQIYSNFNSTYSLKYFSNSFFYKLRNFRKAISTYISKTVATTKQRWKLLKQRCEWVIITKFECHVTKNVTPFSEYGRYIPGNY